jgi:dTDP-4-dehydrorhamnose 3,5-epimerase
MEFRFERLKIPGVVMVESEMAADDRGFFAEIYKYPAFSEAGIKARFVQDNYCRTVKKGVIRGLHYQINPSAQGKLIRVISGEIYDVAVDIRKNSRYFGRWAAMILSADNNRMIYVPEGFAHGYCTLKDNTEILYKCTSVYSRENERGIIWNDPAVGIKWPVADPVVSARDSKLPPLKEADNNFL